MDIGFDGSTIGLVVRGKNSPNHVPNKMDQHADCILADGSPVGFYGEGGAASGGSASQQYNRTGLNMKGAVYDFTVMRLQRPYYVDVSDAKRFGVVSTVLIVPVSAAQAALFSDYWRALAKDPGSFYLIGFNCSTHASDGFRRAGVVPGGIPGLDTPDNLYRQIVKVRGSKLDSYSGYVGFKPSAGGTGYTLVVEPIASPAAVKP